MLHVAVNHVAILREKNTKDEYIKDKITEIREQIHTYVWIDVWIGFGTSAI